jgi:hypothetical protein
VLPREVLQLPSQGSGEEPQCQGKARAALVHAPALSLLASVLPFLALTWLGVSPRFS